MEIRMFLGLAWYYQLFVEGFSSISSPSTQLTQKIHDLIGLMIWEYIPRTKASFDVSTKSNYSGWYAWLHGWCFSKGIRLCDLVVWLCNIWSRSPLIKTTERSWKKLSYAWPRACVCDIFFKDLEVLLV